MSCSSNSAKNCGTAALTGAHTTRVSSRHPQLHPALRQRLHTFTHHTDLHNLRSAVHLQLPLPLASPLLAADTRMPIVLKASGLKSALAHQRENLEATHGFHFAEMDSSIIGGNGAAFTRQQRWCAVERGLQGDFLTGLAGVVGLGDMGFAADQAPWLTTVRINGPSSGETAALYTVDRAEGRMERPPILDIGFSIIERQSA